MESSLQSFSSLVPSELPGNRDSVTERHLINFATNSCESDVEKPPFPVILQTKTSETSFCRHILSFLRENKHVRRFLMIIYGVFLLLEFMGLGMIYLPRAVVCCIKYKVSSDQCNSTVLIEHDIEMELFWMSSQIFTGFLCCCVVVKWHGVEGVKLILWKLKKLPKFWCIVGIFIVSLCTMILKINKTEGQRSPIQTCILLLFGLHYLIMVILVPLLNYTKIFAFCDRESYTRATRLLVKLTLVLLFVVILILFSLCLLQLAFKVSGIDDHAKVSLEFQTVFLMVRDMSVVLFFSIALSFFWNKLFHDGKNILSHMQNLDSE